MFYFKVILLILCQICNLYTNISIISYECSFLFPLIIYLKLLFNSKYYKNIINQ